MTSSFMIIMYFFWGIFQDKRIKEVNDLFSQLDHKRKVSQIIYMYKLIKP